MPGSWFARVAGLFVVAWFGIAFPAGAAKQLELLQSRWGFDGRALPGHFNLLSVTLVNRSANAFEGEIALEETFGVEQRSGAPLVETLYLVPNTERTVQFAPFVLRQSAWRVRWGPRREDQAEIEPPTFGGPARVLLVDPSALPRDVRLKTFPDDSFPPHAAPTAALEAVVLDHVPRWEPVRRRAFADWVRQGGVVHLAVPRVADPAGFSGDLEWLNTSQSIAHFGAGTIFRHEVDAAAIDDAFLAAHGSPAREIRRGQKVAIYNFDDSVLRKLAAVTQPNIQWELLYVLTALYIVFVGPGLWTLSKKHDYRLVIGAFAGLVILSSTIFGISGRRGAYQSASVYSLAHAHMLEPGRHLVTQWSSAFATHGATYRLTHPAGGNFYSTGAETNRVNGAIHNGRDGFFDADIPVSSTRPFIHAAVLAGDDCSVRIREWPPDGTAGLAGLVLETNPRFPKEAAEMWARRGDQIQRMTSQNGTWIVTGEAKPLTTFFAEQDWHAVTAPLPSSLGDVALGERQDWIRRLAPALMLRALGGGEQLDHVIPPE
jgi:hypothetical protein